MFKRGVASYDTYSTGAVAWASLILKAQLSISQIFLSNRLRRDLASDWRRTLENDGYRIRIVDKLDQSDFEDQVSKNLLRTS